MSEDKSPRWKSRPPGKIGETYTVERLMSAFNLNKDDAEQLILKYNGDCERINDSINSRKSRP